MVAAFATSDTKLSAAWAVAISLLAFGLQLFLTSGRRLFLAPSFLALLFGTGYPLHFASLVSDALEVPLLGWGSVGKFAFTDEAMVRPFQTIAAGVLGIAAGVRLAESVWSGLRSRRVVRRTVDPGFHWVLVWALVCLAVASVCAKLGIGRTGLENATRLPLRLNGILVIARGYLLPVLGVRLVQRALDAHGQKRTVLTLLVVAGVAVVSSFGALSRGLVANYTVPMMLFALLYQDALGRSLRRFGLVAALMVVLLAITGFAVNLQRTTVFAGEGWMSTSEVAAQTDQGSGLSGGILDSFVGLIGARIGVVDVFLALASGPGTEPGPWIPIRLFIGDASLTNDITLEALGLVFEASGEMAFGIGYSLWGLLCLGSTILVPFLGSALVALLVCSIEGLLARYGEEGMGAVLGSLVAFTEWGGPSLFYVVRMAVVVVIVFVLARQGARVSVASLSDPETAQS